MPLVTAVVPAFNAAETIRRAIDSVLAQTYSNYEIVVIDDASRDGTADVVARCYGDRVRLLRLARNQGASHATNEGVSAARGEFIAFLDADDEWLPEKLARQVEVQVKHPGAVMTTTGCRFVDKTGNPVRDAGKFSIDVGPTEVWRLLLARTMVAKPCVMARTETLRAVGPFDTDLPVGEDQDMWIRLAMAGGIEFMPDILTIVHDTEGSLTKTYGDTTDRYVLPMIRRHVAEQRHRLLRREVRAILGERYATVGRNLYSAGLLVRGGILLLRAVLLGHRIGANLWYLITALPPVAAVKRLVRRFDGHGRDRPNTPRRSTA